jgi:uncharacterized protein involved in tolerance to divalent cations
MLVPMVFFCWVEMMNKTKEFLLLFKTNKLFYMKLKNFGYLQFDKKMLLDILYTWF